MVFQQVKDWQIDETLDATPRALYTSFRYGRWPDPFKNQVKRLDVLTCEQEVLLSWEFFGRVLGNFFWSNFLPGPWELTRKTVGGSYKCGFYFGAKFKSPIDMIWKNTKTGHTIGRILGPAATAFYFVWAAQTVNEALDTYQSLQLKIETCDSNNNEVILKDARGHLTLGHNEGAPVFATVVWDPQDRAVPTSDFVEEPNPCQYVAYAFGNVVSQSSAITDCRIKVDATQSPDSWVEVDDTPAFGVTPWYAQIAGTGPSVVIQPQFECEVGPGGIFKGYIEVTRFICEILPLNGPPPHGSLIPPAPEKPYEFCEAFQPPYV